jgi:hypothetical protein
VRTAADTGTSISPERHCNGRTCARCDMRFNGALVSCATHSPSRSTICSRCLSSTWIAAISQPSRYSLSAFARAPWLSDQTALQLLNFHDCQPHPLARRDQPICITDRGFCVSKMHVVEDQLLIVMTVDIPGRPESWMTLVGLHDQSVITVSGDVPVCISILCFPFRSMCLPRIF